MGVMRTLKAEMIERQLRERMRKYCSLAETCPHIGRNECAKCAHNSLKLGRLKDKELEAEA